MDIDTIKALLELGWPAIITVFFGYLAIQYITDQRKQITTLWERVATLEGELIKVKAALLEAHLLASNGGTDRPQ